MSLPDFKLLQPYLEQYEDLLRENGDMNEAYKWDGIDHFQQHWNIEAENFREMFQELLYPATETVPPEFKNFKKREHQCAAGRLNIIEEGRLKGDIGEEILSWYGSQLPVEQ